MAKQFLADITGARLDNPLLIRINSTAEGGQINFARGADGAQYWYIDSFNSTSPYTTATESLRFIAGTTNIFQLNSNGSISVNGSVGTSGQVLTSGGSGASASWTTVSGSGMTNPMTTAGDIIYGGTSGTPTRLGIGSASQVLTVIAGNPSWSYAVNAVSGTGLSLNTNTLSLDADLEAIANLAGTSGILTKTAANTWSLDTTVYGSAISFTAGSTSGPVISLAKVGGDSTFTFPSASATASGIVTTGAQTFAGTKTFSSTISGSVSGSAATLATPRAIYGNNFDGSAALTQIISATYGGTGNGFTAFSGPATSTKTFTLPNANATILTDNAAVTAAQGGTGQTSYTIGDIIYASGTTALSKLVGPTAANQYVLVSTGTGTAAQAPSWTLTSGLSVSSATKSTNLVGGNSTTLLGSIPYQSNTDTTSYVAVNTTTTKKFLRQTGTGTNGAIPAWDTLVSSDIPDLSATYQPLDADLTAIGALAGTSGILTKTGAGAWSLDTTAYGSSLTVTDGTTAGPVIALVVAGVDPTITIPSASATVSGVVTTGAQTFAGVKTLSSPVIDTISTSLTTTGTAALWNTGITTGTISIGGAITTGTINIGNSSTGSPNIYVGVATSGSPTVNIGASAGGTSTVNIATSSGKGVVNIGSGAGGLIFGTNATLSAVTAGAMEYDGARFYLTNSGTATGRAQVRAVQSYRRNADSATTTSTTLVSAFGVGLTLEANTLYYFRQVLFSTLNFTAATVSLGLGFTFSSAQQEFKVIHTGTSGSGAQYTSVQSTPSLITLATVTSTTNLGFVSEGYFKSNATTGGTFTPGFAMGGTAGSALVSAGSYIEVIKIGSVTTTTIAGAWA